MLATIKNRFSPHYHFDGWHWRAMAGYFSQLCGLEKSTKNEISYKREMDLPGNPLGLENLKIKDEQMISSGNLKEGNINCHAYYARKSEI